MRGTAVGFPFGVIPAGGTEIPTFLSYATETQARPSTRSEFGTVGAIEGVAGPEAANNAAVTGTLVPLLTLGIPTSVTAAILLSARSRTTASKRGRCCSRPRSTLVWALMASLYIGNVMLLVLNLPMVGLWVKLLPHPDARLLYAGILIFATVGVYGMRQSAFDLYVMLGHRPAGRGDAALRLPDRAGHRRPDPGPARRGAPAQRRRDRRRERRVFFETPGCRPACWA